MKNIYAVLGMSRTGTSAVARLVEALGVSLGNNLIQADARNPRGFYEDQEVLYRVNRGLSHAINYQWLWHDSPETTQILSRPDVQPFFDYAVTLVNTRLEDTDCWGFKDPATATLLPFWRSVFAWANVRENYVIVMRNPLATAVSFQKFVGENIETGLLLWLKHMIGAIDGTRGQSRAVISYELLLESPVNQLKRLHTHLSVPHPLSQEAVDCYANEFLDKSLRHHAFSNDECARHPAMRVVPLCMRVYELLMQVARDEMNLESDEFGARWNGIKAEYYAHYPVYCYVDSLLMRTKELQREIRHMRHGLSWKLMLPLRVIEGALRNYRRKRKESRRVG